jgi:hypothetical protein
LTPEQLRERLSSELRRYMAPVALPAAAPSDGSDAGMESPLRTRTPMGADESDSEMERPL